MTSNLIKFKFWNKLYLKKIRKLKNLKKCLKNRISKIMKQSKITNNKIKASYNRFRAYSKKKISLSIFKYWKK